MPPHIIVLGGLNMDLVVRVPVIPKPGETITGTSFATFPGGKGANQAVALARLGARVSMIGRSGADDFGRALRQALRAEGVNADYVGEDARNATGVALITVEDSGQNNISVASGANMQVTVAEVEAALNSLAPFDLLLMPLEVPLESILAAAAGARRLGARLVLNPSPAQPLPAELVAAADVLVPNEVETAMLTGMDVSDETGVQAAAQQLRLMGVGRVVVTLGGRGALLIDADGTKTRLQAHPVKVVDTTAAGDAFVAGLTVGLGEGLAFVEAARMASAAGALAVTRLGAQPSLPRRAEVEELLKPSR
jgi:ribokinase